MQVDRKKKTIITISALLFVISIAIILACVVLPHQTEQADSGLEMPDAMKELIEQGQVEWMAGMQVDLDNCQMKKDENSDSNMAVYYYPNYEIHATAHLQNGLDQSQPYRFMIFADGIPAQFRVKGSAYYAFPVDLTKKGTDLEFDFSAEFPLKLGRLDFLLFYEGNPSADYHMSFQTLWMEQDTAPQLPTDLFQGIPEREGLQEVFQDGSYGAWLWNDGIVPDETDGISSRDGISIRPGEELLLEVANSNAGTYRTVLMINGQPVTVLVDGERRSCLDWSSNGDEMLQLPITIPEDIEIGGSFYTVTTPLNIEDSSKCDLVSFRIPIQGEQE